MIIAIILCGKSRITTVQLLLFRYENFPLSYHLHTFQQQQRQITEGKEGGRGKSSNGKQSTLHKGLNQEGE